jgi:integrase
LNGDAADALAAIFMDPALVLSAATTRLYRRAVIALLADHFEKGIMTAQRVEEGISLISALLLERRGRPVPRRTSARKCKNGTEQEYRAILTDFKRRVRSKGHFDRWDGILSKLILIGPFLGLRPCEWLTARLVDGMLIVKNAKYGNGRAPGPTRTLTLSNLPAAIRDNVADVVDGMQSLANGREWGLVLRVMGERLARVCSRLRIRRWSLYTLRHVAEATWKKAGKSLAEIAALSGHISTRTARKHYAGGRHGWSPKFACALPDVSLIVIIEAYNESPKKVPAFGRDGSDPLPTPHFSSF